MLAEGNRQAMIRHLILSLIVSIVFITSVDGVEAQRDTALKTGDVFIAREQRPRNRNGNCVWCAAQTVFYGGAGHESFAVARDQALKLGWHGSSMSAVLQMAEKTGVAVKHTYRKDYQLLYDAVKAGTGAYFETSGHALALVGIDNSEVRVIDNNGSGDVQSWSRQHFDRVWIGVACFPCKPRRPSGPGQRPLPINPEHPKEPEPKTPVVDKPIEPKPELIPPPKSEEQKALEQLTEAMKTVVVELKELKSRPLPKDGKDGKDGASGKDGKDGKNADPKALESLQAQVNEFKGMRLQAILYDQYGQQIDVATFGPGEPLRLKLVPLEKK